MIGLLILLLIVVLVAALAARLSVDPWIVVAVAILVVLVWLAGVRHPG